MAPGNTSRHEVRAASARLFAYQSGNAGIVLSPDGKRGPSARCRPKYRLITDSKPAKKNAVAGRSSFMLHRKLFLIQVSSGKVKKLERPATAFFLCGLESVMRRYFGRQRCRRTAFPIRTKHNACISALVAKSRALAARTSCRDVLPGAILNR